MPETPILCLVCGQLVASVASRPDRELYLACPAGHMHRVTVRGGAVAAEAVREPRA